jgi:hypothetical protein
MDRLRRRHRDARHDGRGRPPRAHPRPGRQDAEPQVRDRDLRHLDDIKAGKVEYRTDRAGIIHLGIGKRSFEADQLLANYGAVLEEILRAKPAAAKGRYIKSITIAQTMGPGVRIDPAITPDLITEAVAA